MRFLRNATVVLLLLLLAACGPSPQAAKHYQLTGKVVSIDRPGLSLVVNADAVPGFMAAMAMPYKVKDGSQLNSLVPGDSISAVIVLQNNDYWLENIQVTKHSSTPPVPVSGLHLPSSGDAVPNFELVNQSDQHIFLDQYRGKVLLVTFIYTRCPFPDYCPRVTGQFAELNRQLEADPKLVRATHLLSISFDPQHDTPSVLRHYGLPWVGDRTPVAFDHWEFAVPLAAQLPKMAEFFGLSYNEDGGVINHSLSTAVIGADGRIFSWYHGTEWQVKDLVKDATDAVHASS
ncbi:MAG TPA: SCO family protein [Terriglobales bacterium]|nr:SCO family protein [Terriglobales bacterium]